VLRSIVKAGFLTAVAALASYLLVVVLARTSDPEVFAEYAYVLACGVVLQLLIDCASDQSASHFILARERDGSECRVFHSVLLMKGALLLLVSIVVTAVHYLDLSVQIPLGSLLLLAAAFGPGPILELMGKNIQYASTIAIERVLLLLLVPLYISTRGLDVGTYAVHLAVSLLTISMQWRLAGLRHAISLRQWRESGEYVRAYWPIYLSQLSQAAYGHLSRIVVQARKGLLAFGSVALAMQVINIVSLAQSLVERHFRPEINRAVLAHDVRALRALSVRYFLWYVLPLGLGAMLVFVAAESIVAVLFGAEWTTAAAPLRAMAPLLVSIPLLKFAEMVATPFGMQRVTFVLNMSAAACLLLLLSFLPTTWPVASWMFVVTVIQTTHTAILLGLGLRSYGTFVAGSR
jgi:O-antigen/teichoic acid export membrane protein